MADSSNATPVDDAAADPGGNNSYVVVARRYRPRGFDELVGQDQVGRALRNAIETNRVGHAYLFTGARGVGKTSTARIFAKALNDPSGPTANPDNDSDVAQAIDSGEDIDVIEIDGASNRGIDEIRSLRANVGVRPSRSRYKIYIIDEVHMLTGAAFNALLKTLEEPPEHVKFIFCTTDPEKIPITVLSRCQRFDFAPVEVDKIVGRLRQIVELEGAKADDAALELIARRAAGSMRDSQSLLEQVMSFSDGTLDADQVHAMLGTADDVRLHALATAMADRDPAESLRQLDAAVDAGVDAGRLAEQLLGYFRDLMAVTVACDPSLMRHTSASLHGELAALGEKWGLQTVLAVVGLVDQTLVRIRHSVYARVLLEATLIQICTLPDLQNIADLADAARSAGTTGGEKKKQPLKLPANRRPADPLPRIDPPAQSVPAPKQSNGRDVAAGRDLQSTQTMAAPKQATQIQVAAAPSTATAPSSGQAIQASANSELASTISPTKSPDANRVQTSGATRTLNTNWSTSEVDSMWKSAVARLEDMTASMARSVERVEVSGANKLRLIFPSEAALTMRRCEEAVNKANFIDAISKELGSTVSLELQAAPAKPSAKPVETVVNRPSRMQRMREIESNPLVQSCVQVFGAEIVRIDRPS